MKFVFQHAMMDKMAMTSFQMNPVWQEIGKAVYIVSLTFSVKNVYSILFCLPGWNSFIFQNF